MNKWSIKDMHWLEKTPTSPKWFNWRVSEVLFNSTNCRCRVESVNPTTGEYRIVLQGTLDIDEGNNPKNYS